jgi:lipopolysaccharide/colanic/teichoic acid biosynthesis glycosyltransferase
MDGLSVVAGAAESSVKRAFDIALAAVGLLALSPLLLLVAIAVRCSMGAPVFFRHVRPGLYGQPFVLLKFRTMAEPSGHQQQRHMFFSDAERLTRIGRFLRRTSLDEIPQLFNVLRGHMSLVGPRPLLMEYLPLYSSEHQRRHNTRPGITGLAQINGRQAISFSKRLNFDVWYVDHWSVWLDVKILLITAHRVLWSHGVVEEPQLADIDDVGFGACLGRDSAGC